MTTLNVPAWDKEDCTHTEVEDPAALMDLLKTSVHEAFDRSEHNPRSAPGTPHLFALHLPGPYTTEHSASPPAEAWAEISPDAPLAWVKTSKQGCIWRRLTREETALKKAIDASGHEAKLCMGEGPWWAQTEPVDTPSHEGRRAPSLSLWICGLAWVGTFFSGVADNIGWPGFGQGAAARYEQAPVDSAQASNTEEVLPTASANDHARAQRRGFSEDVSGELKGASAQWVSETLDLLANMPAQTRFEYIHWSSASKGPAWLEAQPIGTPPLADNDKPQALPRHCRVEKEPGRRFLYCEQGWVPRNRSVGSGARSSETNAAQTKKARKPSSKQREETP